MTLIRFFSEWLSRVKIELIAFAILGLIGWGIGSKMIAETEKISGMFQQTNDALMAVPDKVDKLERMYVSLNRKNTRIENGIEQILDRLEKLEQRKRGR